MSTDKLLLHPLVLSTMNCAEMVFTCVVLTGTVILPQLLVAITLNCTVPFSVSLGKNDGKTAPAISRSFLYQI